MAIMICSQDKAYLSSRFDFARSNKMDESNEGDHYLLSLPGPSNPCNTFHTPANPVGLGIHPRIAPPNLPEPDESFEGEWAEGASPAEEEESGEVGEGDEGDEEECEGSEASSVMFDRDLDPEGWAKRLDELAGVLEMGEEEARALRWGPALGRERDGGSPLLLDVSLTECGFIAPDLPLEDFRALINHHLTTTEWRYTSPTKLFPPVLTRGSASLPFFDDGLLDGASGVHPIRVTGTNWIGRDVGDLERRMGELGRVASP